VGVVLASLSLSFVGGGVVAGAGERVTLCHYTGDSRTPYNVIEMSASGAYHAHYPHHEDIVPPFEYRGDTYSRNWDARGQAIWRNGCVPPERSGGGGGGGGGGNQDPPQTRPNAVRRDPTFTG
jgi:hypothetical protein